MHKIEKKQYTQVSMKAVLLLVIGVTVVISLNILVV